MSNNKPSRISTVFYCYLLVASIRLLSCLIIFILYKLEILNLIFGSTLNAIITLYIITAIIGLIINIFVNWSVVKPYNIMLNAMKKLELGDFSIRIEEHKLFIPKPLDRLRDVFNTLAQELESIEILKTDFVNTFSHQFKTPMVSMRGFASLLNKNGISEEEQKKYTAIIISETDRLSALATKVLDFSKLESQTKLTSCIMFDISEQIRRALILIEKKWTEKKLDIDLSLDDVKYYGNKEMLFQMWLNILDNAVKFSYTEGKLIVKLTNFSNSILFSVQDFGCGMDTFAITHIFDRFYQADPSHTSSGAGLGMSIVKKITDLHKGTVTVESSCGEWTIITVILPI